MDGRFDSDETDSTRPLACGLGAVGFAAAIWTGIGEGLNRAICGGDRRELERTESACALARTRDRLAPIVLARDERFADGAVCAEAPGFARTIATGDEAFLLSGSAGDSVEASSRAVAAAVFG